MFHILVVDDDKNTRKLIEEVLRRENFTVSTSENGKDALEKLDGEHIDLVVLDVMMPKKDGFALAQEIRTVNSEVPIIFLTAKSIKEDILEGFKIGADD